MKTTNKTFDELKATFAEYVNRAKTKREKTQAAIDQCNKTIAECEGSLADVSTLDPAEYKAIKGRMDEAFDDLEFYEKHLAELNKAPAVTDEEYKALCKAITELRAEVFDAAQADLFAKLHEVAAVSENYTTELNKIAALRYVLADVFGKPHNDFTTAAGMSNILPAMLSAVNNVLLGEYDKYCMASSQREARTTCLTDDIMAARRELLELAKSVDHYTVGEIQVNNLWPE